MVDVLGALGTDTDSSVRAAAKAAALSLKLPGKLSTHEERLRKLYRKRKRSGQLPAPRRSVDKREEIKKLYAARDAQREQWRQELAGAEKEADALGLKLTGNNLVMLRDILQDEHHAIELLKIQPADHAYSILVNRGIETFEEAVAAYDEALAKLPLLEKKIQVLERVSNLRFKLGISPI